MPIWRNWHETVSQQVARYVVVKNDDESRSTVAGYNATTKRLCALIGEATDTDRPLRAAGGGWSFSPVAATDGILLDTRRLNYRFNLGPQALAPGYDPARQPVLLQCGISVADINKYLDRRKQALPTSGASNGQTIAGALATGTHGAAIDVGAMQECVVGLHIAATPDETLWVERAGSPVLADGVVASLGARRVSDDDIFNAALVSFGSFGLVLGVAIEPAPRYYLHAFRDDVTLDAVLWNAVRAMDFTNLKLPWSVKDRPYHFELLHNPHGAADAAKARAMYRRSTPPAGVRVPRVEGGIGKGDSALDVIGVITNLWPDLTPVMGKMFERAFGAFPREGYAGTPGQMFKDTSTRGRGASAAMGLPLAYAQQAFHLARDAVRRARAPAILAMRFVKAGGATLGFTMHPPVTCVLEVDGAHSNRTLQAQWDTWRALEDAGIPYTFHWGKMNDLDSAKVRARWGAARVQRWVDARRRLLPAPAAQRVFANAFTDRLDLSQ